MKFSQKLMFVYIFLIVSFAQGCNDTSNEIKNKKKKEKSSIMPNTLTEEEVGAGWELLFDGKSLRNWRGYNQTQIPHQGWYIDVEKNLVGESGGAIISKNKFVNFDLKLEFKLSQNTNSGIFYKVKELKDTAIWSSGIEYELIHPQMISKAGDISIEKHSTSDVYDLFSQTTNANISLHSWNRARIVILNDYVEHWLNDQLYLEYQIGSEPWDSLVPNSKFRNFPMFGKTNYGHIGLQQDIGIVKFRNIKIKEL